MTFEARHAHVPPLPLAAGLGAIRRRAIGGASEELVRSRPLFAAGDLPLLVEPTAEGVDLAGWAAASRAFLDESLARHGGILFRGFQLREPAELENVIGAACGQSLEYRERSSPRHAVSGRIYSSTDYPPSHPIFLHNENSYQKEWPLRIFFFARQPAAQGGATPIADCRRVLARIDPEVRERFAQRRWMYVRNFGDGFGLTWQTVFQTEERGEVEAHCRASGIELEWKEDGRLRLRAVRPAIARHPRTGDLTWFNHATFFHVSTLEPDVRAALVEEFAEEDLPANSYYGDGAAIEPEVLEHLRAAYCAETVSFSWQPDDLLMLDNMLVAHGRAPFSGRREILVGMADAVGWAQAQA